jgi:hypothetical protein
MIEHQPDMDVISEVFDPIGLLFAVKEMPVDVIIITPVKENGMPKICKRLLHESPLLKIVTISAEGKTAILYQSDSPDLHIEEPSEQTIFNTIRKSMQ